MMKKAAVPKGLCINCAVHDALRHIYPVNLILARSGPKGLALPHIQRQFYTIAKMAGTDAAFEEIDWQAVIDNWDLPFPSKLRRFERNPVTEEELAMARLEGEQRRAGTYKEPMTEEEYEAQRQAAIDEFPSVARVEDQPQGREPRRCGLE